MREQLGAFSDPLFINAYLEPYLPTLKDTTLIQANSAFQWQTQTNEDVFHVLIIRLLPFAL